MLGAYKRLALGSQGFLAGGPSIGLEPPHTPKLAPTALEQSMEVTTAGSLYGPSASGFGTYGAAAASTSGYATSYYGGTSSTPDRMGSRMGGKVAELPPQPGVQFELDWSRWASEASTPSLHFHPLSLALHFSAPHSSPLLLSRSPLTLHSSHSFTSSF